MDKAERDRWLRLKVMSASIKEQTELTREQLEKEGENGAETASRDSPPGAP